VLFFPKKYQVLFFLQQKKTTKNHQVGSNLPQKTCYFLGTGSFIPPLTTCASFFVQSSPAVLDTNGLPNVVYDFAKISGLLPTTWQENIWLEKKIHCLQHVGGCQCLRRKYTEKHTSSTPTPQRTHSKNAND